MRLTIATKKMNMGGRQPGPRSSEIRINSNSALKHLPTKRYVLAGPFLEEFASPQIKFVRLNIGGGSFNYVTPLTLVERETQGVNDATRDFVLYGKDVGDFAIESLRP